ncbi:MAG: beta-ketoacyl-[acyl-carrier-protein] synthase family protein [Kangiellaceae bacterium]|nr:beta-ketoacyl-[acyl-carrier-protein] synthase family protein [Kangiellaceae bacterium]
MNSTPVYLNHMGMINSLGSDNQNILDKLFNSDNSSMSEYLSEKLGHKFMVGAVTEALPTIPAGLSEHNSRNNQLLLKALQPFETTVIEAIEQFGASRVGIVLGTSTSGIDQGEQALAHYAQNQELPQDYHYQQQELGDSAQFLAQYLKISGPAYVISTACSSSGKVFASARSLIQTGICDLVLVGGVDSLCEMTLNGFRALEATSESITNPFSVNRQGINIGEGAALFFMSKQPSEIQLCGVGESSDAHHISAPHPQGFGAAQAMRAALDDAQLEAKEIHYLNLHGTGTPLNDSMESHAYQQILTPLTPCSSTKPFIGHTLGAAGANELAFCWLLLSSLNKKQQLIPHLYDGQVDPELSEVALVGKQQYASKLNFAMSNSFAFGGNNVSVIIGKSDHD